MVKKITVNLDDLEIDISLDKLIEKEVEKRLDKEVEKRLKKVKPEFTIHRYGRRQGNTFRTLLKAQLLASGEPNQNIFFLTHNTELAMMCMTNVAESMKHGYGISFKFERTNGVITLENGSRLWFRSYARLENSSMLRGMQNVQLVYDNY